MGLDCHLLVDVFGVGGESPISASTCPFLLMCDSLGGSPQVRQPGGSGLRLRLWALVLSVLLRAAASP